MPPFVPGVPARPTKLDMLYHAFTGGAIAAANALRAFGNTALNREVG